MTSATRPPFSELVLVALIILIFITPGVMTLGTHYFPALFQDTPWLNNSSLAGMVIANKSVDASRSNILHGKYQDGVAARFNDTFGGRELLIRLANEAWFRLFRTNGLASNTDGSVVVSRGRFLIQRHYLVEYAFQRPKRNDLLPLIRAIATIKEECKRRGAAFVLLITPSKAAIFPERLPSNWRSKYDPRPRGYPEFLRLLTEEQISFVDAHAILASEKDRAPAPLFPLGGAHWSDYGCWLATRAVLRELQRQGQPVRQMDDPSVVTSDDPQGTDKDLLALMNLAIGWHYPVARVNARPLHLKENERLSLTIVGGSFMWQAARLLGESEQFAEVDVYYYYKGIKTFFRDGIPTQVSGPVPKVDLSREVFASNCVVLEINEAEIPAADPIKAFAADVATAQKIPAQPLAYEGYQGVAFDEDISFCAGQTGLINPRVLTGFGSAGPDGTWSNGTPAKVHLTIPVPRNDLTLIMETRAVVNPITETNPRVTVYVNDDWAAEWTPTSASPEKHEFRIAAKLLEKQRLVLRFEISDPLNLARPESSNDPRRPRLILRSLRLREAGSE